MGWIGCVDCKKFLCDFVARTFALIALVQPILYRASISNKTIQNASKHEFRANWVDRVHSLWKFWCDFVARTSTLIAPVQPVLHRVSCSNETLPNAPKHYETHQNISLGTNGVDRVRSLRKILCDFVEQTFALIAPVRPVLYHASCSNETIQNAPKHEFRANWVDRVHFLRKILMRLRWHELLH